ncbi:rhodanese-like domain-containing protein [Bauldia litoralis]|uniref:Rhodanese-related sulfurtransferase n=1 Tax=Bauldia litoralis TaxID=665467 RepID=A0A1G6AV41_9HYPH|nr:rhodanese-like domain-containing protein [Bauldia litoralis]SDB12235.1 Rhodanese-related sulfurtransferase [Bauldia litoralis]
MTNPLLTDITVNDAHALLDKQAVLVDVREPNETAAEAIPGSIKLPLSVLARGEPANLPDGPVVFLCASGARTTRNSAALASLAKGDAYCMTGGIMAWKRAGLPTERG